jgi:hypothetical protein
MADIRIAAWHAASYHPRRRVLPWTPQLPPKNEKPSLAKLALVIGRRVMNPP